jgi:hypothetical protein
MNIFVSELNEAVKGRRAIPEYDNMAGQHILCTTVHHLVPTQPHIHPSKGIVSRDFVVLFCFNGKAMGFVKGPEKV